MYEKEEFTFSKKIQHWTLYIYYIIIWRIILDSSGTFTDLVFGVISGPIQLSRSCKNKTTQVLSGNPGLIWSWPGLSGEIKKYILDLYGTMRNKCVSIHVLYLGLIPDDRKNIYYSRISILVMSIYGGSIVNSDKKRHIFKNFFKQYRLCWFIFLIGS